MLRALLLGFLAVSAPAACKGKSDAPSVAVGTAAGKVVELAGKVTATRDGKTRDLAVGADVFRDDEIATAADATVTIELFHNNAKWAVVSNKKARVDGSLAWGLDKQEASKTVEHTSAAAGRNAERSAADTASTTAMREEAKPNAATEAAPAEPAAAPPPPAEPVTGAAPGGSAPMTAERGGAPPPPPPPPPRATAKNMKPGGGADGATQDEAKPERMKVVITPQQVAEQHRPELQKCLDPQQSNVTITIKVRNTRTTVALSGRGNLTDKVRSCVDNIAQKIDWPVKGSTFEVVLKFE